MPATKIRTIALAFCVLAMVSGCSDDKDDSKTDNTATSRSSTSAPKASTPAHGPLEGAGTEPVAKRFDGAGMVLLTDVKTATHDQYDRVVFEFRGDDLPGYNIGYVDGPIRSDGSGEVIDIDGDAYVQVRMEPASGFDSGGEGTKSYKGPTSIKVAAAGSSVLREVTQSGDFEAVLSWAIGLENRVGYRVSTLTNPTRLVIDFSHN